MPQTNTSAIIDGIMDIAPPVPPATGEAEIAFYITLVLFILLWVIFYLIRYRSRPEIIAKKKIRSLIKDIQTKNIDRHQIIYQLSQHLAQGLKVKQLNHLSALPHQHKYQQTEWEYFIQHLEELRYSRQVATRETLCFLARKSLYWLKQ